MIRARRLDGLAGFEGTGLFELAADNGLTVRLIEAGATLVSLRVPDRGGAVDLVTGYDRLADYRRATDYAGAMIGRVAGRIGNGRLTVAGSVHRLDLNQPPHHLHGGAAGFDRRPWRGALAGDDGVRFTLASASGEGGYPGRLDASVTYRLVGADRLLIEWTARSDRATAVDIVNHSYFNLAGHGSGSIADHWLTVPADHLLELAPDMLPTGRRLAVAGTPFDFRDGAPIGPALAAGHPQIRLAHGLDHFWETGPTTGTRPCVMLRDPGSGRTLAIRSDRPGVQIYSANYFDGGAGKGVVAYPRHAALAIEPQFPPDAVNRPDEPGPWLAAGETLRSASLYCFGWPAG